MIYTEKNNSEQEENSSSLSNENEFKELDNEIEKVVRGNILYEDEKVSHNDVELNNSSNTSQNSNKNNINLKADNKQNNNHDLNTNATNKNNNLNIQCNDESSKTFKNNVNLLNVISNKSVVPPLINSDNNIYNNNYKNFIYNSNNLINNNIENNTRIPEIYLNNNSCQNISPINLNLNNIQNYLFISGNNNINLKEFTPMNNKNQNGINNYQNNTNNFKNIDFLKNINQINNNLQLNNNNINNNSLLSNMNYYFFISQLKEKALYNNILNNMIINNQISNPFNMNLQFNNAIINNTINSNQNDKLNILFNNKNNLFINGFKDNINNNLSHNIQINNNENNGIFPFNNGNNNINNQINLNDEIMLKLLENQINNNNIKKQINNINSENSLINSNKKKNFNPLSDSEKEKNIINLLDIFQCKDLRTTLMIKNIPNKYTITTFLKEINNNFKNTYDIFYLPIDYINKCNLGFAFINFVEPFHIILFYEIFRGKKWKKFNSDKICDLLYAKIQGRKELISHFEKGKVLSFESEDKRPLILPVPHPLPKINLPIYYLDLFLKLYPHMSSQIKIINNKNDKSPLKNFSINGNFHHN